MNYYHPHRGGGRGALEKAPVYIVQLLGSVSMVYYIHSGLLQEVWLEGSRGKVLLNLQVKAKYQSKYEMYKNGLTQNAGIIMMSWSVDVVFSKEL